MATNAITLGTTALFGNPLWRNASVNPLTNAQIPAAIASSTPVYKISTTQSAELLLTLQPLSITAIITGLQVVLTQATQTTSPNLPTIVSIGYKVNGVYQYTQSQPLVLGVVNTLIFPTKPDGTPWVPSDISNTVVKIIDQSTSGLGNLASLAVNAISTTIPTVSIIPQEVITSSTPQIAWTYADGDLALQSGYQVQVIDPVTGAAVVDSGFVTGLDTTYQVPVNVTVDNHLSVAPGTFVSLPGSPTAAWSGVHTSLNGAIVYGAVNNGSIYKSTDIGVTFNTLVGTSGIGWNDVVCSDDGTQVYGVASGTGAGIYSPLQYIGGGDASTLSWDATYDGGSASTTVWTDTFDAGTATSRNLTVVPSTIGLDFISVACSSDGAKVYAVSATNGVYVSLDAGLTFAFSTGTDAYAWRSVACSLDGTTVYGVVYGGSIYKSTDSGATFTVVAGTSGHNWTGVTCSADATKVYATVTGGSIYKSADSGTSFSAVSGTNGLAWTSISTSASGTNVFVASNGNGLYISFDSGSSFHSSGLTGMNFTCIVSDSDASKIYAGVTTGNIYIAVGVPQYIYQVRVAKNVNGNNTFTAYSSFTPRSISYNDSIPAVGVALVGHDVALTIALDDVTTLGYTSRNVVVLRQWSGGYGIIRNGTKVNVGLGASTIVVADLENPTDKTVSYKVKEVFYDASGNAYVGTAMDASIAVPALPTWWIQKCDGYDVGTGINTLLSGSLPINRTRPQTHLYPLGSRYPVTVSGTVQGYNGEMTIYFDNNNAFISFLPYLDYVGKLMISSPAGAYKYITLDKDDVQKALSRGTDILREMHLAYTEENSGLGFNEPYLYEF